MGLIFGDFYLDAVVILTVLLTLIISYFNNVYNYWLKRGVPFLVPRFPIGNTDYEIPNGLNVGIKSMDFHKEIRSHGWKFGGIYLISRPILVITDPDYIKDIMLKDFQYFPNRGFYHNEKDDPVSAHLFAVNGASWRKQRVKLTPTFTSGKMKMMFDLIIECSKYMLDALEDTVSKKDIDIKDFVARFTTDVIGTCAFGINCNSFRHPDAEFRMMGVKIFENNFFRNFKLYMIQIMPSLCLSLGFTVNRKDVSEFFSKITEDVVNNRIQNNVRRQDFLQLLIDQKLENEKNGEETFTMPQLAAQVFLFFIAGFDTSSTAMTFALYELAKNEEIQEKVRAEVRETFEKNGGRLTYESLNEMRYLSQVIDETLRMYPPVPTLTRDCVQDYKLRDTDITIEKGTTVMASVIGIHRDPEYYPDPDTFDPERFSDENKRKRHPYLHLPFGEGPRNCIGLRFGLMQTKVGLSTILKDHKLSISPATKPVKLNRKPFLLSSVDPIYLIAEKV